MTTNTTEQTLAAIQQAQKTAIPDPSMGALAKTTTFAQSSSPITGLTAYDLEAPAKLLYPVLTPIRNRTPRVSGKGGIQANWRAITGINTTGQRAGVGEGKRGSVIAVTEAPYTAVYKGLGLESNASFEAQYAGEGFDDVRARAVQSGLNALMIQEEFTLLGGNTSILLGTTPTPSVADVGTGGTLAANLVVSVICVALSLDAFINGSVAGGIQGAITQTGPTGQTITFGGGAARKSTAAAVTTANDGNATHSVTATVAAVNGAVAYAWFWGLAGAELLGAITTINSNVILATATGTQTAASLAATDYSTNAYVFDGLLTQALKSGSGATVTALATGAAGVGTVLTSGGDGGITQIDAVLKSMWDNYRLSPSLIEVSSQQMKDIRKLIMTAGSTAAQRFVFNAQQGTITGGSMVVSYLNPFSMGGAQEIPIRLHPYMPAGTMLFTTQQLPYQLSNVSNVYQVRTRQEYYQIEWPLINRMYEYGVYVDEVLQHFFPPSMAVLTNIAPL